MPHSRPSAEWSWTVLPTTERRVALTIDAGDTAEGADRMLRALVDSGATATFFLAGIWVERFPALARDIAARYRVGNHTYGHEFLTSLPDALVEEEITRGERVIKAALRIDPKPLFRFPYADLDARTTAIARRLGYTPIGWTVDTAGWRGVAGGMSVERVLQLVVRGLRPGAIYLIHIGAATDGATIDADMLPTAIREIRNRGYGFATIDEFMSSVPRRLPEDAAYVG